MADAVFLDRDGVLVEDIGYAYKIEDFRLCPGTVEGLRLLKGRYLLFIITNQPGIGKGYYTHQDFRKFNDHLVGTLQMHGITIEKTHYCPHTKEAGCDCRKPSPKHLKAIASEYGIDVGKSWVIGDHPSDVEMGERAGCRTAYVLTGHGKKHYPELEGNGIRPTFVADGILSAAARIAAGL